MFHFIIWQTAWSIIRDHFFLHIPLQCPSLTHITEKRNPQNTQNTLVIPTKTDTAETAAGMCSLGSKGEGVDEVFIAGVKVGGNGNTYLCLMMCMTIVQCVLTRCGKFLSLFEVPAQCFGRIMTCEEFGTVARFWCRQSIIVRTSFCVAPE